MLLLLLLLLPTPPVPCHHVYALSALPQTVCAFWLRGMCMKGEACGFLHKFDPDRMPVCRVWMKTGGQQRRGFY
jgi:hypothetical protein